MRDTSLLSSSVYMRDASFVSSSVYHALRIILKQQRVGWLYAWRIAQK